MIAVSLVLAFATALLFSLAAVPVVLRVATAYGYFDLPDAANPVQVTTGISGEPRRIHSRPIPRLGGVAIVAGFFLTQLIWNNQSDLWPVFIGSAVVFLMGLLDDLRQISAKTRLLVQIACAMFAVISCGLAVPHIAFTPTSGVTLPTLIGIVLAVFIIVGAINAINMIDGLDGLAGGVVLIGVALLSFVHFQHHQDIQTLFVIVVPMIGAILGFLKYNTYPAKIFMGDSGSNWLGFMMGILLLIVLGDHGPGELQPLTPLAGEFFGTTQSIRQESTSPAMVPFISAIMCLALPVFDTACVILLRWRDGLSPMHPDKRHFHHTLLRIGLSHSQSVTAMYFIALSFGIVSITPIAFNQRNLWWAPYAAALMLAFAIPLGMAAKGKLLERILANRSFLVSDTATNRGIGGILRKWESLNRYTLYFILLFSTLCSGVAPKEIGYVALIAGILLSLSSLVKSKQQDFMESFVLSFALGVLLLANNQNQLSIEIFGVRYGVQYVYNAVFTWLFCSTFAFLLFTLRKRYFLITPSDFLVVALPLILLLVPEPIRSEYKLSIIALRCLVFFMAIRTMVKRRQNVGYRLRLVTIVALGYIVLTSLAGMRISYQ